MRINFIYAFRNIRSNPVNSIITAFGLSVAIACCLIIYFYVSQEYGYNSFHKNVGKIYRINYDIKYVFGEYKDVRVEPEIVERLKKEIPQIEKSAEYRFAFQQLLSYQNNYFDAQMGYASEDFFDMFSFPLIAGNRANILRNPYEIVITRKLADKLTAGKTGYNNLMGKVVEFPLDHEKTPFKIVGILADIPQNSSINFDAVVSGKSGRRFGGCDNAFGYTSVFYQVKENSNATDAEKNVNNFISKYYQERVERMQKDNQLLKTKDAFVPFVLPFKAVYLYGDIDNCFEKSVNRKSFIILITICILILIIACSNYTILTLGQYLKKIGDVGIRKVMGAKSANIFGVFMAESFILTLTALALGSFLCTLFVPVFSKLAQTELLTTLIDFRKVFLFGAILCTGIVVFTSIIPVLVFSKITPHQMAGNKLSIGNKGKFSQVFVFFQYSLSIILIIVTLFIVRQSNFLKNQSLGIDTSHIIDIRIDRLDGKQKEALKILLSEHPGVINLTLSARNFMNGSSDSFVDKGDKEQILVNRFEIDHTYVATLGLHLIHGKDFTEKNENRNDRSMIVNKKFIESFQVNDEPIGKAYRINGINFTIIGVVDDYHFRDMKSKIGPAMLFTRTEFGNSYNDLLLKYQPKQLSSVINHIEKCYEQVAPGKALTYDFWNEQLNQRYEEEERWSKIIGYSSVIAIIISSLGLLGLTILLINQRVKEIGIRKVNGAQIFEILLTINKSFIAWLLGSLIIAMPVAYYIVTQWLSNFPYKVEISWWVFIMAGSIALFVALLTVSWQSWKAATRNPVDVLHYD